MLRCTRSAARRMGAASAHSRRLPVSSRSTLLVEGSIINVRDMLFLTHASFTAATGAPCAPGLNTVGLPDMTLDLALRSAAWCGHPRRACSAVDLAAKTSRSGKPKFQCLRCHTD